MGGGEKRCRRLKKKIVWFTLHSADRAEVGTAECEEVQIKHLQKKRCQCAKVDKLPKVWSAKCASPAIRSHPLPLGAHAGVQKLVHVNLCVGLVVMVDEGRAGVQVGLVGIGHG